MIKNWKYCLAVAASLSFSTAFAQTVKDAQRSADLERDEEALKMLRKLNKSNPSEETAFYLADAYLLAGKADSAAIYYNQAAAVNAKSPVGMVAAGKAALIKGNVAEAEGHFENAIKRSRKKDAEIYRLIGQAYADARANDISKAISYLETASSLAKNNNPQIYITLGDLHQTKPDGGGPAMTAYEQALRIDRNNAKAQVRRGQLFVRAKNYNEAQEAFQAAIAADPNFAPAYRELGEMYIRVGKYDEAAAQYQKYLNMAGNSLDAQAKYAQFLFLAQKYSDAADQARKVVSASPNHVIGNRVLALALHETDKNEEALAAMENFFKNAKGEQILASDYANYGRILAKAGKTELAQQNLDKALKMDPENLELQDDVASFYMKQKDYPRAIALYKAKLEAKPSRTDSYKLAEAYYAAKQYKEADEIYEDLLKEVPTYSPAIARRAEIAEALENTEEAKQLHKRYIEVVTEAIKADPTKESAYRYGLLKSNFYLGLLAYRSKDYAEAKTYWTEAKRLDPGNKDLEGNLRNVEVLMKQKKK